MLQEVAAQWEMRWLGCTTLHEREEEESARVSNEDSEGARPEKEEHRKGCVSREAITKQDDNANDMHSDKKREVKKEAAVPSGAEEAEPWQEQGETKQKEEMYDQFAQTIASQVVACSWWNGPPSHLS